MKFEELHIQPELLKALQRQRLEEPTEVQAKSIPLVMAGKDLVVRSKTGSGKTFAFLLPILQKIDRSSNDVQALIITPTRELTMQIFKELCKLSKNARAITIYGGVGINPQIDKLRKGVEFVIGTPGRLLDHLERGTLNLKRVRFMVLDEADRMLDMGFIDDIKRIISQTPKTRQTMLFSATMPDEIVQLSRRYMHQPEKLILEQDEITVKRIRQVCYGVEQRRKITTFMQILRDKQNQNKLRKAIVFCNTKRWTSTLTRILRERGIRCDAIHSSLSQMRRNKVIEAFKQGRFPILVATDVAARGLHIDDVSHVFNYDLPKNPKDYVHRIGRTGRAGAWGDAISLVTQNDEPLLHSIELEIQNRLEVRKLDARGNEQKVTRADANAVPRQRAQVSAADYLAALD